MSRRPPRRHPAGPPPGFTLIEMVVSLAVFAVLIGAMGSAIILSTHAMPTRGSDAGRTLAASETLQQMADELRGALYLTEAEPTAVAFILLDADGDGHPEAVRYAWAGVAGQSLTRQLNGGEPVAVLQSIDGLALSYASVDTVREFPGARIESEELLMSRATSGDSKTEFSVKDTDWIGIRVKPNPPADVVEWRITRTLWSAASRGKTDGVSRYRVVPFNNNRPVDSTLDSTLQLESSLPTSPGWVEVAFDRGGPFLPGEAAAVIVTREDDGSGHSVNIDYFDKNASPVNLHSTNDAGNSWTVESDRAVLHYAYGRYTTQGPDWTLTRQRTGAIDIALTPGKVPGMPLVASVDLVNAPDAVSRRGADFDANPAEQDLDFDGDKDWDDSGGAFSKKNLNGGWWTVEGSAEIKPATPPLDEPLTLSLRMRDTQEGVEAAWCEVRFDRGGNRCGHARLEVVLAGGVQRFSVVLIDDDGSTRTLAEAERPAEVTADLGLIVDPAGGRALGTIDGEVGTCLLYETVADDGNQPSLLFNADGNNLSGVEVDAVTLRVGGLAADVVAATPQGGGVISNVVGGTFGLLGGGR